VLDEKVNPVKRVVDELQQQNLESAAKIEQLTAKQLEFDDWRSVGHEGCSLRETTG
jgi:hypothetical protein